MQFIVFTKNAYYSIGVSWACYTAYTSTSPPQAGVTFIPGGFNVLIEFHGEHFECLPGLLRGAHTSSSPISKCLT